MSRACAALHALPPLADVIANQHVVSVHTCQMVIEQLFPEFVRPGAEGRLQAGASQALFLAFRDAALAAKACFEAGLHNQGALAHALAARCV